MSPLSPCSSSSTCEICVSFFFAASAGKFVTVVGNVVRVSGISAMVLKASFACPKCGCEQTRQFVDGKFNPPTSCPGANCKARVRRPRRRLLCMVWCCFPSAAVVACFGWCCCRAWDQRRCAPP